MTSMHLAHIENLLRDNLAEMRRFAVALGSAIAIGTTATAAAQQRSEAEAQATPTGLSHPGHRL
jgi:hypothetical protein